MKKKVDYFGDTNPYVDVPAEMSILLVSKADTGDLVIYWRSGVMCEELLGNTEDQAPEMSSTNHVKVSRSCVGLRSMLRAIGHILFLTTAPSQH